MTFRNFIEAMCNVTGEELGPAAAQSFLLAVTQDGFEVTINSLKSSTFNSYLREGRNLSKSFACEIEADYMPTELKEYLNEISKGRGGKQRLCDAFREYCRDIEPKNAIKQIVKLFEQMLREAKQSRRTRAKAVSKKDEIAMPKDTEKLDCLLKELTICFSVLYTDFLKVSLSYNSATADEKKALDDGIVHKHHDFYALNDKLYSFVYRYRGFTELETLYDLGQLLVLDFFRPWSDTPKSIIPEDTPDDYRKMLAKVKKTMSDHIK